MKSLYTIPLFILLFTQCTTSTDEGVTPNDTIVEDVVIEEETILEIQTGKSIDTVEVNGTKREYTIYIPSTYDGTSPLPILLSFHGLTSNMEFNYGYTKFHELAEEENFIVIHPNGISNKWVLTNNNNIDVDFVQILLDHVESSMNVDMNRIYSTGMSMGGFFSFHLACHLTDRIAAIASVTGSMYQPTINTCTPSRSISILQIHGTEDNIVPYSSIEGLLTFWTNHNQTDLSPEIESVPDINTEDGSTVERYTYSNGEQGTEVHHIKITGGEHDWPGFKGNMDISASLEVWNFLKNYDLNGTTNF
ncbi:alpha/beta hydrolase family esterase [Flammeovirga agarivorans]|uniref:Phospholipase/carboxylesterase/thioesterase domain-containing protein n=1 Tax=Flammeovirga agarivorans TaxID=2726742 RepID=A0A7X8SPJ6_9BACT|nr:dienelactone hydrolase family protein [Flammeovirga agarivorans]NLR94035.1 hypothetical protein [Flammeovirga agarivorans]